MNIRYLTYVNNKLDYLELKNIKDFHVSRANHSWLFFVADEKEYTSEGTIFIEEIK